MGRKFSRASSARVDLEGSFELQGCLAEAWLVKEAAAILLASWIPDGRSPLKSVNLHTWLHALSHKSTTCVIRIQSIYRNGLVLGLRLTKTQICHYSATHHKFEAIP